MASIRNLVRFAIIAGIFVADQACGDVVPTAAEKAFLDLTVEALRGINSSGVAPSDRGDELLRNRALELLFEHGRERDAQNLAEAAPDHDAQVCVQRAYIRRAAEAGDLQEVQRRLEGLANPKDEFEGIVDATRTLAAGNYLDECRQVLQRAERRLAVFESADNLNKLYVLQTLIGGWSQIGEYREPLRLIALLDDGNWRITMYCDLAVRLTPRDLALADECMALATSDLPHSTDDGWREIHEASIAQLIGLRGEFGRVAEMLQQNQWLDGTFRDLAVAHAERMNLDLMRQCLSRLDSGERARTMVVCADHLTRGNYPEPAAELMNAAQEMVPWLPPSQRFELCRDIAHYYALRNDVEAAWQWAEQSGDQRFLALEMVLFAAKRVDSLPVIKRVKSEMSDWDFGENWSDYIRLLVTEHQVDEAIRLLTELQEKLSERALQAGLRGLFTGLGRTHQFGLAEELRERFHKAASSNTRDDWLQVLATESLGVGDSERAQSYFTQIKRGDVRHMALRMMSFRLSSGPHRSVDTALATARALGDPWERLVFLSGCKQLIWGSSE